MLYLLRVLADEVVSAEVNGSIVPVRLVIADSHDAVFNTRELSFDVAANGVVTRVCLLDRRGVEVHGIPVPREEFKRRGKYVIPAHELRVVMRSEGA